MNAGQVPALAPGVRFRRDAKRGGILLIPEGVVNLNGSAAAIVELINGDRSVGQIVNELQRLYPVDEDKLSADVDELLQRLAAKTWVIVAASEAEQKQTF